MRMAVVDGVRLRAGLPTCWAVDRLMVDPEMANLDVAQALRRLADDVETGQYKNWIAQLNMSRSPVELNPMAGECELDGLRHFRPGDVVDVTLVLTSRGDET